MYMATRCYFFLVQLLWLLRYGVLNGNYSGGILNAHDVTRASEIQY
jgi:hypothetical protein